MLLSRQTLRLALLTSTLLTAFPAAAQQAEDGADDGEIIVTAQKREENLQRVPLSIQAIGTERLDQLQVNDMQDYVKFLPSVTIQSAGPGFSQVYFRGVASGENANHSASLPTVGTYLDEMPITTIQGALDIHAFDLARVEALAGPQGTLYGASSMAGTIKLVTNKPDPTQFSGEVGAEVNSVAHGAMGGILEGYINAPLSDKAAIRAVGWYRKDGGYIDNIAGSRVYPSSGIRHSNAPFVEKNYNDAETYGGRVALGIDLDDDWTLRPTIMGQVQKTNGSFAQENGTATPRSLTTIQYNPESSKDKWMQAALTIEGKIGNWDITATGGYLTRKDKTESDYSDYSYFYDTISGYGAYFYDNNGALVSPNQYIQGADKYRRQFGEFRIASPQDSRLRLIAGVFWQQQKHLITQNYIIDNIADAITVPGTASDIWLTKQLRKDKDLAAFGEMSFDVSDKLTLTGGLRVYQYDNSLVGFFGYAAGYSGDKDDKFLKDGVIVKDGTGVAGCGILSGPVRPAKVAGSPCTNVDKSTKDTDFIHKINATYKFNDDALVYGTWSRGFRPGGINRRGTLPPYGPDQLDNFEFGWKTSWGRLRWNGAIFQENWDNIQLSFLGANGLTEIRNAGKARIRGIETDISYRQGGLTLSTGASLNNAKLTSDFCQYANAKLDCSIAAPDSTQDLDLLPDANSTLAKKGTRLPVTAKFKGNAIARYEFPVGGNLEAHVQMAVNYTGKRRSDLRDAENLITGNLGAFTTADLSLGIKGERWTAEIFATNLFDSRGIVNRGFQCIETTCGDPNGVTARGGISYDTPIRPRLIGVKVGTKF
jgi:iron complex outermembrane receptor protein